MFFNNKIRIDWMDGDGPSRLVANKGKKWENFLFNQYEIAGKISYVQNKTKTKFHQRKYYSTRINELDTHWINR